MRSTILLAAVLAALATLTGAARNNQPVKPLPPSAINNATHFLDPQTTKLYRRHACAVHDTNATASFKHLARALHAKTRSRATGARAPAALARRTLPQPLTINAYFHIITTAAKASTVTPAMAAAQAAALNAAYNPIGITFNHVNTSFTTNDAWAVAGDDATMSELKLALRAGSYRDLNLYFHTDLAGGILGTCTLPSRLPPASPRALYASDGCNIAAGTLPGGAVDGYNAGGTAAHETGHWLGLLHVFEGYDCGGEGDLVDDTPAQSESTDGCPVGGKDSCPGLEGADSVHNWMDYSTDACYEGFTAGQVGRVGEMWALREGL